MITFLSTTVTSKLQFNLLKPEITQNYISQLYPYYIYKTHCVCIAKTEQLVLLQYTQVISVYSEGNKKFMSTLCAKCRILLC
jgi:hypothetical protein